MLSFIKKLFGFGTPAKAEAEAPYKVEKPAETKTEVVLVADAPVVATFPVEGAGVVEVPAEAPAKKPRAKKPAAAKATAKKPRAKKAK